MELVRDWRRQAARAAGATALAPAVLLTAAVLLAAGGGLGGIGSLGQIAAGPSVPPAELAARQASVSGSTSPEEPPAASAPVPTAPSSRGVGDGGRAASPAPRARPVNRRTIRPMAGAGPPRQQAPPVRPPPPIAGNRPTPSPALPPPARLAPTTPEVRPPPAPGPVQQILGGLGNPQPVPGGLPTVTDVINGILAPR